MKNAEAQALIGRLVWYKTGNFTASRARVLDIGGSGATLTFVVDIVDKAPSQPHATDFNRNAHPDTGGIRVSARKVELITPTPAADERGEDEETDPICLCDGYAPEKRPGKCPIHAT